jgi:hypothetical protein
MQMQKWAVLHRILCKLDRRSQIDPEPYDSLSADGLIARTITIGRSSKEANLRHKKPKIRISKPMNLFDPQA